MRALQVFQLRETILESVHFPSSMHVQPAPWPDEVIPGLLVDGPVHS